MRLPAPARRILQQLFDANFRGIAVLVSTNGNDHDQRIRGTTPTGRLLDKALAWVRVKGWPTRVDDEALADATYRAWITRTHDDWVRSGDRDRDLLDDMLAFRPIHDDRDADSLWVIFVTQLEYRGREEDHLW